MDRAQLLNDGEEAMRLVLDGRLSGLWTSIPGIVTKVDLTACTCEVQPAIQGTVEDENGNKTLVNLPLLVDVPIFFASAGNFALTFPLAVGNEVIVVFAARCIDAWWQWGGVQRPMEARMHDLSDAFAFPARLSQPVKLTNISGTAAQLRTVDGTTYLELAADGKVKILGDVEIEGDVEIDGNLDVTGEVTADGIPLSTHIHATVGPLPGMTGGPTP